jgi:hypothetical protein
MAEKIKNVNLRISVRLWERLLAVSGPLGYSRAAFIRLVLEGVAYSNNVSAYVPRKAQGFVQAVAAAVPTVKPRQREPQPEYKEPPLRVQPYNPQQNYCETRALGVNHEHALQSVLEECHQRGIEWECTQEIRRLGDGWI